MPDGCLAVRPRARPKGDGDTVADPSELLLDAMTRLEEVARTVTPDEALDEIDAATLQSFWREWPAATWWAGALWRRLNDDLAAPAEEAIDPDTDEVGGSG